MWARERYAARSSRKRVSHTLKAFKTAIGSCEVRTGKGTAILAVSYLMGGIVLAAE